MNYHCSSCLLGNRKLWRPSHVTGDNVYLMCWSCLETRGHRIQLPNSDQVYNPKIEVTNYVPAVPDWDGSWWGYTSVPRWWCAWWDALPDKDTVIFKADDSSDFDLLFEEALEEDALLVRANDAGLTHRQVIGAMYQRFRKQTERILDLQTIAPKVQKVDGKYFIWRAPDDFVIKRQGTEEV